MPPCLSWITFRISRNLLARHWLILTAGGRLNTFTHHWECYCRPA